MSAIGSISTAVAPLPPLAPPVLRPADAPAGRPAVSALMPAAGPFSSVLDRLVGEVDAKQAEADATTRRALLGDSGSLHQSVIAMQEASLALSLMIEVRNKVIDSYQEIMRMPV